MTVREAKEKDKAIVANLLDEFRADCIEQITGKPAESDSAKTGGVKMYEDVLHRNDYCLLLLEDSDKQIVGVLTGYLCPMLRSGEYRAEVEEFFVQKAFRGGGNARLLMDAFFEWCQSKGVKKVNLESDNELHRAHAFYQKYGFESKAQRFVKKLG